MSVGFVSVMCFAQNFSYVGSLFPNFLAVSTSRLKRNTHTDIHHHVWARGHPLHAHVSIMICDDVDDEKNDDGGGDDYE